MSTSMQEHMAMTEADAREIEDLKRQFHASLEEIDAMTRGALEIEGGSRIRGRAIFRLVDAASRLQELPHECPDCSVIEQCLA